MHPAIKNHQVFPVFFQAAVTGKATEFVTMAFSPIYL